MLNINKTLKSFTVSSKSCLLFVSIFYFILSKGRASMGNDFMMQISNALKMNQTLTKINLTSKNVFVAFFIKKIIFKK